MIGRIGSCVPWQINSAALPPHCWNATSRAEPMADALREAAAWVGCDDVRLEQIEPAEHAGRLAAALART